MGDVAPGMFYADGIVRAINESTMIADTMSVFTCPDCRAINAFWVPCGRVCNAALRFATCKAERCYKYVTSSEKFTLIGNSW